MLYCKKRDDKTSWRIKMYSFYKWW
jgi:hypothetical protein